MVSITLSYYYNYSCLLEHLVPSLIEGLQVVQGLRVVPVFMYRYSMENYFEKGSLSWDYGGGQIRLGPSPLVLVELLFWLSVWDRVANISPQIEKKWSIIIRGSNSASELCSFYFDSRDPFPFRLAELTSDLGWKHYVDTSTTITVVGNRPAYDRLGIIVGPPSDWSRSSTSRKPKGFGDQGCIVEGLGFRVYASPIRDCSMVI